MQLVLADLDQVEVVHHLVRHDVPVDPGAVGAREILHVHRAPDDAKERVSNGDRRMVDDDIAVRVPADDGRRP